MLMIAAYERMKPFCTRRRMPLSERTSVPTPFTAPSTMRASMSAMPWNAARPGPPTRPEMAASYLQPSARMRGSTGRALPFAYTATDAAMPAAAMTTARPSSNHLFWYAHVLWMSASASCTTGSSQCSRKWVPFVNGSWMAPPTTERPASTTSGRVIVHGLSWGAWLSPCAPCSSAWSCQRASPKKTMMTWRVM